ncbi:hypothetical protein OS190_05080 [Sulfitobacter sp. F26204]|uniref:hypothetical protein n=1 Tax=Sulfitobacter sp. F26204 TaxID=2996014 RepID=UPI00225DD00F|nr:hypothetical protein [Sulfitobacter sp. F26204]MCX7558932.1 hypothetical protein [Sulfitobacter sp. F26204]
MLNSYRKGAVALAAALSFVAGAAHAEEHVVIINDGSYFPNLVFATPGDKITFQNRSDTSHTLTGEGQQWTSGSIASEGAYLLEVKAETPPKFSGLDAAGNEVAGEIVFAQAPSDEN